MNRTFRRGIDLYLAARTAMRIASESRRPGVQAVAGALPASGKKKGKTKGNILKELKRALRRLRNAMPSPSRQEAKWRAEIARARVDATQELRESVATLRVELVRQDSGGQTLSSPGPVLSGSSISNINDIVVIGAGGHAKVVIELLAAMGERVAYCIGGDDAGEFCLHVPVLRGDENLNLLRQQGFGRAFVAVGSAELRGRLAVLVEHLGYKLVNAISPTAVISPTARLGRGVAVMAKAVINAATEIGDLAIINTGATIDHDCQIGRLVHVGPRCGLAGNVIVGASSFLGIGCSVIPRIRIGAGVSLGAGSVVVRDVPDGVTAVGVPAHHKIIRMGTSCE